MNDVSILSTGLRIRIVGHTSPRWVGARSHAEADRLNHALSVRRAHTVHALVERLLRAALGPKLPIPYASSHRQDEGPAGVELGSFGEGSATGLRAANGDRGDNSARARRVEVAIERVDTHGAWAGLSLPARRQPGASERWSIRLTSLRAVAIGAAVARISLRLTNRLTGKSMDAYADLAGGGLTSGVAKAGGDVGRQVANTVTNNLGQAYADLRRRGEALFLTRDRITFAAFDGTIMRMGRAKASLGYGARYSYVTFPLIEHVPDVIAVENKTGWSLPGVEGWVAAGTMRLDGVHPGDDLEEDVVEERPVLFDTAEGDRLALTFGTGQHHLAPAEQARLASFVRTGAAKYARKGL